jgi:hypothetical protein
VGKATTNANRPAQRLEQGALAQLRLGHLGMIQGIVGRLAGFSATVKNFSVTLAAAAVAVNLAQDQKGLLWIALGAVVLLLAIDTYYLAQERAFRELYDDIAGRSLDDADNLRIERPGLNVARAAASFSIWGFYPPQLVVVVLLLVYKGSL